MKSPSRYKSIHKEGLVNTDTVRVDTLLVFSIVVQFDSIDNRASPGIDM